MSPAVPSATDVAEAYDPGLLYVIVSVQPGSADVRAYDRVHVQILHMSDMLSDGLVAQFPSRFR